MTVALCLMTWNEIDGVRHDIPLIDRSRFDDIYCMDGGSTDGTVEFLEENGIKVYQQEKRGMNCASIEGVIHCSCDAFIFFHPKGTIPVEDIYKFKDYFESGYEFIVGSRMLKESHNEEDENVFKPRKWFVLGMGLVCKILYKREGNTIWDVMHGFRGMTKAGFEKLNISEFDRSIDVEMVCRSYKCKIKRIEFPTKEGKRLGGKTHFKLFSTGWQVIKYVFWELKRPV